MKVIFTAEFPAEPFNSLVKSGKAGEILGSIMEEIKPEAVYFTEFDGCRSVLMIIDMNNSSDIPKHAEPFFLNFNAVCRFRIAMTPEDLAQSGLDEIGKKWS